MGRKILSLLMAVMIIIPFAQVVSADNALECAVFFSTEDAEYSPYAEDSVMDNIEIRKNETGTFRIMWYDDEKMVSTQVLIDGQPVEVQEITTKRNEDPSILDTYVNFLITGEVGSEHKAKIIWELMRADDDSKYLIMATKKGIIKRTRLSEYANIRKTGLTAIRLREDDKLIEVKKTTGEDDVMLFTKFGMCIRFNEDLDIR